MNIYVASSWRNKYQPEVVSFLRECKFEVYDFRHPTLNNKGFHWSEIDTEWGCWSIKQFQDALHHPIACDGFRRDMAGMMDCDICVLVMPCGRSAHLEAGWCAGAGKCVIAYFPDGELEEFEPELMYKMFDFVVHGLLELKIVLQRKVLECL